MKRLTSWLAVGLCTALIGVTFAAKADAQDTREASVLTLTEPLDVGGTILQPGDYQLRVVRVTWGRDLVQVWSADEKTLFTTLLTVPHQEAPTQGQDHGSRYVYYPESAGQIKVLRTWYATDRPNGGGHDFVYPKQRAMELAARVEEPVVAIADEVKEAELTTAPLVVVTPEKEVKPYEEPTAPMAAVPEAAPAEEVKVAENSTHLERLPETASDVPLYAGLGLLALLGALGLGVLGRRVA